MKKINFTDLKIIMLYDVIKNNASVEIEFCVDNNPEYNICWMGKTFVEDTNKEIYWFGLKEDGSKAYEFNTLDNFLNAQVFDGENIKEIWDSVTLFSIDACEIEERLPFYLGSKDGPHRSLAVPI